MDDYDVDICLLMSHTQWRTFILDVFNYKDHKDCVFAAPSKAGHKVVLCTSEVMAWIE